MSDLHVRGAAKGQFATGEHRPVTVVEGTRTVEKYEYDVRCEDCGVLLAAIQFSEPKIGHDPADCGLICGGCNTERDQALAETQPSGNGGEG